MTILGHRRCIFCMSEYVRRKNCIVLLFENAKGKYKNQTLSKQPSTYNVQLQQQRTPLLRKSEEFRSREKKVFADVIKLRMLIKEDNPGLCRMTSHVSFFLPLDIIFFIFFPITIYPTQTLFHLHPPPSPLQSETDRFLIARQEWNRCDTSVPKDQDLELRPLNKARTLGLKKKLQAQKNKKKTYPSWPGSR